MQSALFISPPTLPLTPSKNFSQQTISPPRLSGSVASRRFSTKATTPCETSTVDYSSAISVFPAEACETIGGDACLADIFPEVKLNPEASSKRIASEPFDRDYLEYNDPKTVFRGEACDDLGGEFCSPDYERGA
ncbi:light-regulated protein [Carica papaya]|uniref:light-regulated protein n=1 Tax=Carica papaya TaxID=3649 RepID=UPI000B8CD35D|nr:light-regulated protein [Carica papaya]